MMWALVPAYNEEETIGEVISRLKKSGFRVLVVDDGSGDNTYKIAKSSKALVIRHEKNKGKGEALKTGIYYLRKRNDVDIVVIIDADLQFLPEEANRLVDPIKKGEADFVMGKRNFSKVPLRHKLGNFVWRFFFNLLFGTRLEDTNCGFMAFGKKALSSIEEIHGGYIIENSFLEQLVRKKLRIKQVPVTVVYRRISGVGRGIRVVLGVLMFIITRGIRFRLEMLFKRFRRQKKKISGR